MGHRCGSVLWNLDTHGLRCHGALRSPVGKGARTTLGVPQLQSCVEIRSVENLSVGSGQHTRCCIRLVRRMNTFYHGSPSIFKSDQKASCMGTPTDVEGYHRRFLSSRWLGSQEANRRLFHLRMGHPQQRRHAQLNFIETAPKLSGSRNLERGLHNHRGCSIGLDLCTSLSWGTGMQHYAIHHNSVNNHRAQPIN
jgi:hypothetical protein